MPRKKHIEQAKLNWNTGAPVSRQYNDIYFSNDGVAESDHVFLRGNAFAERFPCASTFSIGELGFGAGLNILAAWDQWRRAHKLAGTKLRFFSVEYFPLSHDDLERAHEKWPALSQLSSRLRALYPPPHPGFHRLELDDDVSLTLFYGDVVTGLEIAEGEIDAWFLDGFAPSQNPDMWSPKVMQNVARLSKPGATYATFTVAGAVRRALGEAGFTIERRPGYGAKREMLAGKIDTPPQDQTQRSPWFNTRGKARLKPGCSVAIIGAGIAGASLTHALRCAGFKPTVFDADEPASGASGNPAGLIMPRLDVEDSPQGRFHDAAYLYTLRLLNALDAQAEKLFNPCGVTLAAPDASGQERLSKLLNAQALPHGWMKPDTNGIFFPQAGVVSPSRFVRALLGDAPFIKAKVNAIDRHDGCFILQTTGQDGVTNGSETYDAVVLANGVDALRFYQARSLPLAGSAGQIDWFRDMPTSAPLLKRAIVNGSYAATAPDGGLVIGATYEPCALGEQPQTTIESTLANIDALAQFAPEMANQLQAATSHPRASVRCVTPDQMPVAGPLPDWSHYGAVYDGLRHGVTTGFSPGDSQPGLYILSGLGSRGMVTAPLAAAAIVAEITGEVAPIDYKVAEALHPARFFIRNLKRPNRSH